MGKISTPQSSVGVVRSIPVLATWGMFWLIVLTLASVVLFWEGFGELLEAWRLPEYSHGPLIPVLSALLLLRQLKTVPVDQDDVDDRRPGLIALVCSLFLALVGKLLQLPDIVTYAMILWVGAVLLISFGWARGRQFWPPVLHLIYMLPLPIGLYYGLSTYLQGISSELGVYFLRLLDVPVFLEGNIIDLGVYKLHVAEACSGLRYLFPILSFSYIFAVLYKGPTWHKAVLLIAAAPITILMNSVRIALAGVIVNHLGIEYVEGFSHFFEGWVIFAACIAILFLLAWCLLRLRYDPMRLPDALDLEFGGLLPQAMRLQHLTVSPALVGSAVLTCLLALTWTFVPQREFTTASRDNFLFFPIEIGDWQAKTLPDLDPAIERVLAADDYYTGTMRRTGDNHPVDLFMAWYADQESGGVHSPEVCLPGNGWEIAELEKIAAPVDPGKAFTLNRAIIQKGTSRLLVYYWFEQQGQRTASGFAAKWHLFIGKFANGRNDGAIIRLMTPIDSSDASGLARAEDRLRDATVATLPYLPKFVPGV